MTTAKAQFRGDATGTIMRDFSEGLKTELRTFFPDQDAIICDVWGHPADMFVEHILGVARWAIGEMKSHKGDITRQEIRAEYADLLKTVTAACGKLRNLSPDFERLLIGVDADTLECADAIQKLITHLEVAKPQIDSLPTMRKHTEKMHIVAVELSVLVFRELTQYGISIGATASKEYGTSGNGLKILKAIGDDIGLIFEPVTWRNIVAEGKQLKA